MKVVGLIYTVPVYAIGTTTWWALTWELFFFEDWVLGWRLGQKCRFEICRVLGWETWAKYVFWNCLQNFLKVKSSGGRLGQNMWFEIGFKTFWRTSLRGGDFGKNLDLKLSSKLFEGQVFGGETWAKIWIWNLSSEFFESEVFGGETWAKYVFWNCLVPQMKSMKQPDISVILYKINENSKGWAPSILVISRVPCVHLLRKLYQAFRHGGAPHVIVLVGRLVNNSHQKGAALNFSPVDIKYKL